MHVRHTGMLEYIGSERLMKEVQAILNGQETVKHLRQVRINQFILDRSSQWYPAPSACPPWLYSLREDADAACAHPSLALARQRGMDRWYNRV